MPPLTNKSGEVFISLAVYIRSDGSFELFPCWGQLVSPKGTTCFRHRNKWKQISEAVKPVNARKC